MRFPYEFNLLRKRKECVDFMLVLTHLVISPYAVNNEQLQRFHPPLETCLNLTMTGAS